MTKTFRILALVAIIGLIGAVPAMAVPDSGVPLKGSIVGVDAYGDPSTCPAGTSWRYFSTGPLQMSHLGGGDSDVTHCTVFNEETGTGTFGNGTITLTAANGDSLVLAQSGTFYIEGDPSPGGGGLSIIDGQWTVVDGEGRFEGATGNGTLTGVSDLDAGTTTIHFTGSIVYDASNRSD